MGFFDTVTNFFTGGGTGLADTIVKTISSYFPPSMSDAEKAQAEMAVRTEIHAHEIEMYKLANAQDELTNARIRDLEGTASDLKCVPVVGPVVLLLRGIQRPIWGFAVMYFDYLSITGDAGFDGVNPNGGWAPEGMALVVMNILVLGFLFGERAMQNVMPLITDLIKARKP